MCVHLFVLGRSRRREGRRPSPLIAIHTLQNTAARLLRAEDPQGCLLALQEDAQRPPHRPEPRSPPPIPALLHARLVGKRRRVRVCVCVSGDRITWHGISWCTHKTHQHRSRSASREVEEGEEVPKLVVRAVSCTYRDACKIDALQPYPRTVSSFRPVIPLYQSIESYAAIYLTQLPSCVHVPEGLRRLTWPVLRPALRAGPERRAVRAHQVPL